jgi:hypothetical protein
MADLFKFGGSSVVVIGMNEDGSSVIETLSGDISCSSLRELIDSRLVKMLNPS